MGAYGDWVKLHVDLGKGLAQGLGSLSQMRTFRACCGKNTHILSGIIDRRIPCSAFSFFIQITVFLGLLRWGHMGKGGPSGGEVNAAGDVIRTYSPRRSIIPRLAQCITQYTRRKKKGCIYRESGGVHAYPGGVRVYVPLRQSERNYSRCQRDVLLPQFPSRVMPISFDELSAMEVRFWGHPLECMADLGTSCLLSIRCPHRKVIGVVMFNID